jgi:hypothetical protein
MAFSVQQKPPLYLHIEGNIPVDLPNGSFISITRETPLKIYSLGFQPAKSIPEIPRWFLQKYGTKKPFGVLEPFAGSGTTLIESLRQQASVYWLDYHPLSRLICRVKTTLFSPGDLLENTSKIIQSAYLHQKAPETVKFANKDFWFQAAVQEGLEILKHYISQSPEKNQPLLWVAFASTVRKTSDMNDGMLLAARRANFEKIPERSRGDVFEYFKGYVERAIEAVQEWQATNPDFEKSQELPSQDARNFAGNWTCDAIITSPPYINAIDYVWASKFELHWLEMVRDDKARLELYSKEIGTERIPRNKYKKMGQTGHPLLDTFIEEIYTGKKYQASKGQNELRARVVYQYFVDMRNHFLQSSQKLNPGGYYCFSIGDISKICGVEIPVALILKEMAKEVGLKEIFHFYLLLKNRKLNLPRNVDWAGTIKHDQVIILEKSI